MRFKTFFLATLAAGLASAQSRDLQIYWIDVEGGASTLLLTPAGQSLLVDTGNGTPDDRDAKRIYAATQLAGLKKIDFLLTSHYHGDHVGGLEALAKMIPIERYFDHGDSIEQSLNANTARLWETYAKITQGKRTILKPGDKLPLNGLEAVVVSANGEVLPKALKGGGANPFCKDAKNHDLDKTENGRSAGFLLTFGKFRFADMGDLTWDREMSLACPANKIGEVTMFQATHHGFVNDQSGAPALVWALKPQLLIVNNGPRKGWQVSAWDTAQRIGGLEDVWQIHQALHTDPAHNVPQDRIANLEPTDQCQGHWIKAVVTRDGAITMTNGRNGYSKSYKAR